MDYEFSPFDILASRIKAYITSIQAQTVEEIEMNDCAFLWDLGIRADEDLVRPPLTDQQRIYYRSR